MATDRIGHVTTSAEDLLTRVVFSDVSPEQFIKKSSKQAGK